MSTWAVTLKTGRQQWSTIEVEAADHRAAIASAKRLLGDYPVTDVVFPDDRLALIAPLSHPQQRSRFKKNGKLNLTLYTDPWRKRLWARLRRQPLWHEMGALRDDGPGAVSGEVEKP